MCGRLGSIGTPAVRIDTKTVRQRFSIAVVTSIHIDFDSRIWKHCTSLTQAGYEVHLICPWHVMDGKILKGIRMHTFPRVSARIWRALLIPSRVFGKLFPILKKVNIVHFHDIDLLPWMVMISLFKPVVYDVHENYPEEMLVRDWIPPLLRTLLYHVVHWFQYLASSVIHNIVLVADSQEKHFDLNRMQVLYLRNYATLDLISETKQDYLQRPDTIIFTGSSYESNGTLLLLEIAKQVKSRFPHIKFLMADRFDGQSLREAFIKRIEAEGLNDTVELFPNLLPHKLMTVLNKATIAISPNLRVMQQEMLIPTKLFEYMAAGLPIVASDLPYATRLFSRHPIGLLAQPENPASFVQTIAKLIEDRSLALELGKNGQRIFQAEYSWESQVQTLLAFYDNLLKKSANFSTALKEEI